MPWTTHEAYFASVEAGARDRLERIGGVVAALVPGAEPCIAYRIPAFRGPRHHRCFFHFAAFKRHIGIYPPLTGDAALIAETLRWRGPKGNLSFPLSEPLPLELIGRVALALATQYGEVGERSHAEPPAGQRR